MKTTLFDVLGEAEVEAELFDNVSVEDLQETTSWRSVVFDVAKKLRDAGEDLPEYLLWDWRSKEFQLTQTSIKFAGLRVEAELQGLMKMIVDSYEVCRLPEQSGKPLVYVDYLEAAPRNIPDYMQILEKSASYQRVGLRLMQQAVRTSIDYGYKGRLGLHSLQRSELFYGKIGMVATGPDPRRQNLQWFEFTEGAARDFLEIYP